MTKAFTLNKKCATTKLALTTPQLVFWVSAFS